ncbi:MAG: hypothetical protein JNK35_13140 [Phycisphaerae bacterium]|nr:hypothetical protein [Phycisphaerae bacterium]
MNTRRAEPVQSSDPCTTRTTMLPSRVLGGVSLLMVLALLAAACHERRAALGTYRSEGRAAMASPAPVASRVVREREREEPVRAGGPDATRVGQADLSGLPTGARAGLNDRGDRVRAACRAGLAGLPPPMRG